MIKLSPFIATLTGAAILWPRRFCAGLWWPWRTSSWVAGVDGVHDRGAQSVKSQPLVNHQRLFFAHRPRGREDRQGQSGAANPRQEYFAK